MSDVQPLFQALQLCTACSGLPTINSICLVFPMQFILYPCTQVCFVSNHIYSHAEFKCLVNILVYSFVCADIVLWVLFVLKFSTYATFINDG